MVRGSQACGFRLASTLGLLAVGNWLAAAPARAQTSQDEQAIRTASTAYVQALSRGDGAALAALWTADGDIVDERGTVMKGRDAMSLTTKPAEDRPAPPVHIRDTSLRFLAPGVALEDGTVLRGWSVGAACDALGEVVFNTGMSCLLYTSPSPRDGLLSRMPSSA